MRELHPINDHISFSVDVIEATLIEIEVKGVEFDLEPVRFENSNKLSSFKAPEEVLIEMMGFPH